MDHYTLILVVVGIAILAMAWMPGFSERFRVSYSVLYVIVGFLVYSFVPGLPVPDPVDQQEITLRLSELVVIVSLMGTGLKIDQQFSLKSWRVPLRLISLTMLCCIAGMMALCVFVLDLSPVVGLLLGAILAPTDPVLATDVQVEAPNEGQPENVRFSLTAEAGFNDGVAFPFVWLAIVWLAIESGLGGSLINWALEHVLYKLAAGIGVGYLLGRLVAYLVLRQPHKKPRLFNGDGFVSLAATLLIYGTTEMLYGYGFLAVFVAGLTLRDYERQHELHNTLHEFAEQTERILIAIMLVLFGGSLMHGILNALTWQMAVVGLLFLFVIRPVTAYLSLIGSGLHKKEKRIVSFFGIRGVGSIYYLAFALSNGEFGYERELWAIVSFIILVSIIVHGTTASIAVSKLEKTLPQNTKVIAK